LAGVGTAEQRRGRSSTAAAAAAVSREAFNDLVHTPVTIQLGTYRAEWLYWGVLRGHWWRNYLHAHSFFEVCFAFGGRGSFLLRGRKYPIATGDLLVARPLEPHEIISSRERPLEIHFWAFTLVPNGGGPHPPNSAAPVLAPAAPAATVAIDELLASFIGSGRCVARGGEAIDRTLLSLAEEVAQRAPGYSQALHALTMKLTLDVARLTARGSVPSEHVEPPARDAREAIVRRAVQYLRDNLARRIELRDVAAQVQLSERQLSRVFQQVTSSSVIDYLTTLRMETASQMLLNRDLPIKQVARAVGYPDTHYFTTLFGRRVGMTPAAFRNSGGTQFFGKSDRRGSAAR
jgi:AraC family L-rhamnose operon transcriptional activator RhaR